MYLLRDLLLFGDGNSGSWRSLDFSDYDIIFYNGFVELSQHCNGCFLYFFVFGPVGLSFLVFSKAGI